MSIRYACIKPHNFILNECIALLGNKDFLALAVIK